MDDMTSLEALKHLAEGGSLLDFAEERNIPKSTLYHNLKTKYPEEYENARECRGIAQVEQMMGWARQMQAGEMSPNVFRELKDMVKWQAGKEMSHIYGDKKTLEISQTLPQLLLGISLENCCLILITRGYFSVIILTTTIEC